MFLLCGEGEGVVWYASLALLGRGLDGCAAGAGTAFSGGAEKMRLTGCFGGAHVADLAGLRGVVGADAVFA